MVAPVFLMVAIGYILRRLGIINDNFVSVSSKVVFTVSLPALIFKEVSTISLDQVFDINQIIFVYIITIITFALGWLFAIVFAKTDKDKGAFIQGSFRGNYAIIGLALIVNILGESALAKASLILSFVIPLYNVLTIIILTIYSGNGKPLNILHLFRGVITNPLIVAIILALPFSYFQIELNSIITVTIDHIADLTLPLALVGIGGFLNFTDIKNASVPAFLASSLKIILTPLIGTLAAYLLGYRGNDIGILFIVFACPTAIASFIMAEAMGSNSRLAGNIVLITTIGSILTISAGLFILKINGII
ncbi:MAG: AEC family transporter [Ignavibacteriaceae bacterium]